MNRGIAHRAAFETPTDVRAFLAQVARAAHKGTLELHAFSVLNTHYHLLVRSPEGALSSAMQRIQYDYVRWFNATRRRDGPLFRGRFYSRQVISEFYKRVLVRYIDDNPIQAGLCRAADEYAHGSAHCYVHRNGPGWLDRSWIESVVTEKTGKAFSARGYQEAFGVRLEPGSNSRIQRWIEAKADPQPAWNALLGATPGHVLEWLRERALLADGGDAGFPLCSPHFLADVLVGSAVNIEHEDVLSDARAKFVLQAALMFEVCGLSQTQIASALRTSRASVSDACRSHRRRMAASVAYSRCCAAVANRALGRSTRGLLDA